MEFLQIFVVVLFSLPFTSGVDSYDLCEKGDIEALKGKIYFDSSSVSRNRVSSTCERNIHTSKGRLMLTLTHSENQDDLIQVIDGAFGEQKIVSTSTKDGKTYESTGNAMRIILKVKDTSKLGSLGFIEGTFATLPFPATCSCSAIQNGHVKCRDIHLERNCTVQCQKDYVDLFKSTGNYTCDLVRGRWNNEYKNTVGCVQKPSLPDHVLQVNFTTQKPICDSLKNTTSDVLFNYLLTQEAIKENSACLKSHLSNCFNFSCDNQGNNSFVSINIQDKATSRWNETGTGNQALFNAYNKSNVTKIAQALINYKQKEYTIVKNSLLHKLFTKCTKGTFEIGSQFTCSKCPLGSVYKPDKRTCEKCPNGMFPSKDSTQCVKDRTEPSPQQEKSCDNIACMSGKELDQNSGFCQWCPHNTYRNSSEVVAKCTSCPDGKKTLYRGSSSVEDCIVPCSEGTFFDTSAKKCVMCPLGTFQNSANHLSSWCNQCGNGKVTYSKGAKMSSDCLPSCSKGRFYDNQSKNCMDCPVGSYQNSTNQLKCQKCPSGTSTLSTGANSTSECKKTCQKGRYFNMTCSNCPLGTYMDKSDHLLMSCKECENNKTTYVKGAVTEAQCFPQCSPGHYFNLSDSMCIKCRIGSYQNSEKQLKCVDCPDGTSTRTIGTTKPSDCINTCPNGTFYDGKNSSCSDCPLGTYMENFGHLETKCKECGDKKTTYIKGAADSSKCFPKCKVGQYFHSTLSICKECPRGFYQMKPGQQSCLACPHGMNTTSDGATSNLECVKIWVVCGQGEFYDPKKDNCQLCKNGTYQSSAKHNLTACQPCLSGQTTGTGAKNISDCLEGCDGFPCKNGAECTERNQMFTCLCPKGITGRRCDIIEEKDKIQKLKASVRFTSLEWSNSLQDPSHKDYVKITYKIEKALRDGVFEKDDAFVGVQVTKLLPGSVIAEFDIYMNENMSLVPANALQHAVAEGLIGGLPVDSSFLNISQVTCSQPLGMENGQIADKNIDNGSGKGRLKGVAWTLPSTKNNTSNTKGHLQIQFDSSVIITAIASQGDGKGSFVTSYTVMYSTDGDTWKTYLPSNKSLKAYNANKDTTSVVKNILAHPITSVKFIRVVPESYEKSIAMRVELYGCLSDPMLPSSPPSTTKKPKTDAVKTNPNVKGVQSDKDEYSWGQYLGIAFGLIMAVVVVVSCFLWWRSSKNKKQKEDTPLVMTRFQDGSYREVGREEEDEAV